MHIQKNISRDLFYRSYIQTYIQRDVRDLLAVTNQTQFYKFLTAVAARTALGSGAVICFVQEALPLSEQVMAIPVSYI